MQVYEILNVYGKKTSMSPEIISTERAIIYQISSNFVENLPKTTMKSLRELYRIGKGPSSSHTMGPQKAAQIFAAHNPDAKGFVVTLYGSLAATGRGHMTDTAIPHP